MDYKDKNKFAAAILLLALVFGDIIVWRNILADKADTAALYFLDVGQGDSEVLVLPAGTVIMTDAGPDRKVLDALENALPNTKRIDLAVISHPQMDHFNGFNFLLDKYEFGVFLINGRADSPGIKEWTNLIAKIRSKNIPLITLAAGDRILYEENSVDILSPGPAALDSGELNDTGLVEYVKTKSWKALFLADIGKDTEIEIFDKVAYPADIIKIAHHGSKYSTAEKTLRLVRPKVAVIEVGARNSYGHPAADTLNLLKQQRIPVLRTDLEGTVKVSALGGKLLAQKIK